MSRLLQPLNRPSQEFPHRRGADPQAGADFGVAESFQAQKQAAALLIGKPLDGMVEPERTLAVQQCVLRIRSRAGELGFKVRVGGGMGRTPTISPVLREFLPWNQLMNYLAATGIEVGFLFNFGTRPSFKRLVYEQSKKSRTRRLSTVWKSAPS